MTHFFFHLLLAAFLATAAQQEAAPAAPSVADAAKAARERQTASKPKHILTDDDVAHSEGAADSSAGMDEGQIRAQLEKTFPLNPTVSHLQLVISQFRAYSQASPTEVIARFKRSPMGGSENVDFPGKKEWESQMENAITHLFDEAGKTTARLQTLLDQNQDTLAGRNPVAAQKLRAQCIDAMVPTTAWQQRVYQLILDGQSRAKASAQKPQPH